MAGKAPVLQETALAQAAYPEEGEEEQRVLA
jgi:hypothetical protein